MPHASPEPKHRFIAFDGVEGCGKSTQARLLAEALERRGLPVTLTREPGGTPVGARIRELLLDRQHHEMTPLTEVLLFCADRAQHVAEVIRPALAAGQIVVSDRFASSTAAYQAYAGGIGFEAFDQINAAATGGLLPDLTIILDADPAIGFSRKFGGDNNLGDRIERKSLEFHMKVREGFLQYTVRLGERCVVLDAAQSPAEVHCRVMGLVVGD
jgi:dTMP kinase